MKLSIITINFNDKDGLQKTIKSVIGQSFDDFEYIVIDGGSTDGSVDVVKKYVDKIAYWVSEPDKGIYNAMNKGIAKANGEYCLFLNSGDCLIDEGVLEKTFQCGFVEDFLYGDLKCMTGNSSHKIVFPDKATFYQLFTAYLPHPSTFIKKRCFDMIGTYDEKYAIVSDWAFFAKAIGKYNCTTRHLPWVVSCHLLGGISSQQQHQQSNYDERQKFLKTEFPAFYEDYTELVSLKSPRKPSNFEILKLSVRKYIKNAAKK